mgnify:FL=1
MATTRDQQLVYQFQQDLVMPAAKAFIADYFTEKPSRLNEPPFGPFIINEESGEARTVTGSDAEVKRVTNQLYGGTGTKWKKKFIKEVRDARMDWILDWAKPQNMPEILPLASETSPVGPPPNESAYLTSEQFVVFMNMLQQIGRVDYGSAGTFGSSFGSGNFYKNMWLAGARNQPQWIALVKPIEIDGEIIMGPLYTQPDLSGWQTAGNAEIRRYDQLVGGELGASPTNLDNIPTVFKNPAALYIKPYKLNLLFKGLIERVARSNPDELQTAARAVAKEIWGDINFAEQKRAIQSALPGSKSEQLQKPLTEETTVPKKRNLTPNDFQCYLLERISELSATHKTNYKHVVMVDTNSQPALVTNAVNHTPKKTEQARTLLNLCPDVYGALVPYIRLSRVEYDSKGKIIPSSEKELEIPNFLKKTDLEKILDGDLGRAPGAGIKSFSWTLAGVQPAEVDNNISAKLEIYFQTVADFFASGSDQGGKKNPSFLDLIIASPTIRDDDAESLREKPGKCLAGDDLHQQYDGVNFRIKVCAGWATPDNLGTMFKMKDGEEEALESALEATRVSLYLQQVRHNIDFQQDGAVTLSIDYQASLSGLLKGSGSDIFASSSKWAKRNVEAAEKEIDKLDKKRKRLKELGSDSSTMQPVEEKLASAVESLRLIREEDKLEKYRKLLKNLFREGKVYNLPVPAQELLLIPYADLTPSQRAERAKRRKAQNATITDSKGNTYQLLKDLAVADTTEEASKAYSETESKRFVEMRTKYTGDAADTINVPFFYLGDLLDNVLEQIKENQGTALDFNFFLSDVEMVDPLLALQFKNIEQLSACGTLKNVGFLTALIAKNPVKYSGFSGVVQLMNIGDIPISVDAFQLWFKNAVVAKGRSKYFFLHFVKDICNGLITKALRSICFGPTLNFEQRFDAQPLTLAPSTSIRPGSVVNVKTLARARQNLTCEEKVSKLGLILMPTDSRPKNLKGQFNSDLRKGIYHNYLGSSCGLVKNISFNREDQPYLRESKIQKDGVLGAEQLRELYSAQIDMVGNNLYQNGAYTYISPLLLPSTKKQLQLLGLNGYYLVTSVASTITDQSFDTVIHALHEGVKFGQNQLIAPETYTGLTSEVLDRVYWNPQEDEHFDPEPDPTASTRAERQGETKAETAARQKEEYEDMDFGAGI